MKLEQAIKIVDEIIAGVNLNRAGRQAVEQAWQQILAAAKKDKITFGPDSLKADREGKNGDGDE